MLHYFKVELGRTHVTVAEFTQALDRVLRGLGLVTDLKILNATTTPAVAESDLRLLARAGLGAYELDFFPRLRAELREQLRHSPRQLRFCGLRGCVKQIIGARRWSARCERFSDQIVAYLRTCLSVTAGGSPCALVVK